MIFLLSFFVLFCFGGFFFLWGDNKLWRLYLFMIVRCEFIICSYFNRYDLIMIIMRFFSVFLFFPGFFLGYFVFFWQINKTSHTILLLLHKALLELSDFWRRDRIITSVLTTNAAWNQSINRDMNWPWSPLCISTENTPVTPARLLLRLHFWHNSVVEDSSKL